MPHIIVTADRSSGRGQDLVTLRERVNLSDLESDHFARQLLERLNWAVGDAHDAEQSPPEHAAPERPGAAPAHPGAPPAGPPAGEDQLGNARAEVDRGLAALSGQQATQELEGATL